ncbi:MAG: NrfD/PsrC family molybdoenzyme membrane anchor subunit, partial [Planctomycetota bacterium]
LLTCLTAAALRLPQPQKLQLVQTLARLTVGIVVVDLLLVASEVLVVFYGGMPHHVAGWKSILFGPFWWVFWFVQIGLGAIVPILLVAGRRTGQSLGGLGLAGLLIVFGVAGVRLNIVIPAQIEPEFAALPLAYRHLRFETGYFPSGNEWLVALGTLAIGVWMFLLARKVLPLEAAETAAPSGGSPS